MEENRRLSSSLDRCQALQRVKRGDAVPKTILRQKLVGAAPSRRRCSCQQQHTQALQRAIAEKLWKPEFYGLLTILKGPELDSLKLSLIYTKNQKEEVAHKTERDIERAKEKIQIEERRRITHHPGTETSIQI